MNRVFCYSVGKTREACADRLSSMWKKDERQRPRVFLIDFVNEIMGKVILYTNREIYLLQ
jgi:hypothetical protein